MYYFFVKLFTEHNIVPHIEFVDKKISIYVLKNDIENDKKSPKHYELYDTWKFKNSSFVKIFYIGDDFCKYDWFECGYKRGQNSQKKDKKNITFSRGFPIA